MSGQWFITIKASFQTEWLTLSAKESSQVLEKIALLARDPGPDGIVKKKLAHLHESLHCLHTGHYCIFYAVEQPTICLLALRHFEDIQDSEFLEGVVYARDEFTPPMQSDWEQFLSPPSSEKRRLPKPITPTLLLQLHVPAQFHARLLHIQTQEDLLNCAGVPDEILRQIDTYMFEKPLAVVMHEPEYVVPKIDDLQRYKEGELLRFLLKLAPDQARAANWALDAAGPTQVRGKPGTGKSIVALYRVRSLLMKLRSTGLTYPRILFTTYTNALVESSRQLLQQLLGADIQYVKITTADKLVVSLLVEPPNVADEATLIRYTLEAVKQILPDAEARQRFLKKLSYSYILEEMTQVIMARNVSSMEHYADKNKVNRSGRRVPLSETERQTIWRIFEVFRTRLHDEHVETWQQVHLRAESLYANQDHHMHYDAVVVDEAQDLDPSLLRILVTLCKAPNRFFITADANQSIYRTGFTWADVHESLKFQGRTTVLKTNYRSTRQIGEAAQSFLATGAPTPDAEEWVHSHTGQRPAIRVTRNDAEEIQPLANYFSHAAQSLHFGLNACAVFCPSKQSGQYIAQALKKQGIPAAFMAKQDVQLTFPGVKVMTLYASKGLEFPIVALAGFRNSRFTKTWDAISAEEREEKLLKDRQLLFVGMTRAMRVLLLLIPKGTTAPLLTEFDDAYWDVVGSAREVADYVRS